MPHIPIENAPSAAVLECQVAVNTKQLTLLATLFSKSPELANALSQQGISVSNLVLNSQSLSFTFSSAGGEQTIEIAVSPNLLSSLQKLFATEAKQPAQFIPIIIPKALLSLADTTLTIKPQLAPISVTKAQTAQLVLDLVNAKIERPVSHLKHTQHITFSGNIQITPQAITAKHNASHIELKLNESLRPLLTPQQSVLFELKTNSKGLQLTASLSKNTTPIESVPFNQKRIRQLFTNNTPDLKVFLQGQTPVAKISSDVVLSTQTHNTNLGWVAADLDALGDVTKIKLKPLPIALPLTTQKTTARPGVQAPKIVQTQQATPTSSLNSIKAFVFVEAISLPQKWLTTIQNQLQHFFEQPKQIKTNTQQTLLISQSAFKPPASERHSTTSHAKHNAVSPLSDTTEKRAQLKQEPVQPPKTAPSSPPPSTKAPVPQQLVYNRPTLVDEFKQGKQATQKTEPTETPNATSSHRLKQHTNALVSAQHVTPKHSVANVNAVPPSVSQRLNNIENLAKHLPSELNELVCRAFSKLISSQSTTTQVLTQLHGQLSAQQPIEDQLETPKGAIMHVANTFLSLASASNINAVQSQQLDNLLAVLFKALGVSKKDTAQAIINTTNQHLLTQLTKETANIAASLQPKITSDKASENDFKPQIAFDMPLKLDDKFQQVSITVERDAQTEQHMSTNNVWRIQLAFSISEQPLLISADLLGKQLALVYESSDQHLLTKAAQYEGLLKEKLANHGIHLTKSESKLSESLTKSTQSSIINVRI